MNQRIEVLAKAAGYYQSQDVDGTKFDVMPRQCFEKFAELIIKECRDVAWSMMGESPPAGAQSIAYEIEMHFREFGKEMKDSYA